MITNTRYMKISILSGLLLISISSMLFAQNNTFPVTGNVGIGTSAPQSKLHVFQTQQLGTEESRIREFQRLSNNWL